MRIIFIGTPEFSVPSLEILLKTNHNIVAVITTQDKAQGRGLRIKESAIKRVAKSWQIPILQPKNLKSSDFLKTLKRFKADLQIVIAFRILPEVVWNMPTYGTFNLHASLLPLYRGAAPINWAIIKGEKKTGLTTFFLKKTVDTGDILLQQEESILFQDNAGTLHDRLSLKGADLVLKTVQLINNNNKLILKKQDLSKLSPKAPKIFKQDCEINFKQHSLSVYNFIRGLSPYPSAWTKLNNIVYKILQADIIEKNINFTNQNYISSKKNLYVKTENGAISITKIQKTGKKAMFIEDFLRGNQI